MAYNKFFYSIYEYIVVYVDNLYIVAKEARNIIQVLQEDYEHKLKNTEEISYHLRCDFFWDNTGTLCISPKTYIEEIKETYERMFGTSPKPLSYPLENNDRPEMDDLDELDDEGIKKYQSLLRAPACYWLLIKIW